MHTEKTLIKLNMTFLIKVDELLEKHNEIWKKVKNMITKEFGSEPVYNGKNPNANVLSVILIDSVFRTGKNSYPQCFQKNVNMLLKKKRF